MDEQKKRTNYCRTCGTKIPWWAKETIPQRNGQCRTCWNESLPATGGEAESFIFPSEKADKQTDESKRNCVNCGTELIPNSNYCPRCGTGFNNTLSPISGTQADQPQELKQSAKDDVKDAPIVRFSKAYLNFWGNALAPFRFWEKAPALAPAPSELTPADLALISMNKKNPGAAAVLSFFWAGLGQIYNGQIAKGIVLMIVQVINVLLMFVLIGFLTYPLVWLLGIVDAYGTARKHNEWLLRGEFR